MYTIRPIHLFVMLIFSFQIISASEKPEVADGILDLRKYDFEKNGTLSLDGEWRFYWKQFLLTGFEEVENDMYLVNVPGSWNEYARQGMPVRRTGYATYRLRILLPPGIKNLAFNVHDVFSSSSYYADGNQFGRNGIPATNRFQSVIGVGNPIFETSVENSDIEMVVFVSNYDNRSGGIKGSIKIGLPEQIQQAKSRDQNISYFFMGAFLIIGIYFISLFLIRFEQYRLYFSLICLLMVFRILIVEDNEILNRINISNVAVYRFKYLSFYLVVPFFILMIHSLFPIEFNRLMLRILLWISLAFILVVIFSPLGIFSYTLLFYLVYFLTVAITLIYVMALAWSRGRNFAGAFTIGMSILIVGVINDLLFSINILETGYVSHYTMFIYLLIYAHIFSAKSLRLIVRAESLSAEIQSINSNLEAIVESRTSELKERSKQIDLQKSDLEKMNKTLSNAIKSRNRMFSIIGHDIRGPIGYIRQGLELLVEENDLNQRDEDEMLKLLAKTAHMTYDLLENLMLWGRSQVGNLEPVPAQVNLDSVINACIEVMNLGIMEKRLIVVSDNDPDFKAWIDRDQLMIVIRNLLSNSIKFTPPGGKIKISVSEAKDGKELLLEVKDTGIGIPEKLQEKLFDPEENFTMDGTNHEKGSGLGLKLCKEIIEANNGWISFSSESGKGSAFKIGIPAMPV